MQKQGSAAKAMLRKRKADNKLAQVTSTKSGWSIPMLSTHRESSIETVLFSIGMGEAFGLRFEGLSVRKASKCVQRLDGKPVERVFRRSHNIRTLAAISVGQALLCSASSPDRFTIALSKRLWGHHVARWPQLVQEKLVSAGLPLDRAYRRGRLGSIDRILPGIMLMAVAVQGTTNRITPWVRGVLYAAGWGASESLMPFAKCLARATQYAVFADSASFDASAACKWLARDSEGSDLGVWLELVAVSLREKRSVAQFLAELEEMTANSLIQQDPRLCIIAPIYAWLLHCENWKMALMEVGALGGAAATQCAICSALIALTDATESIPKPVIARHRWFPHSADWIDAWVTRLLQWPHGADDLVRAHAMRGPSVSLLALHVGQSMRSVLGQFRSLIRLK